MKFAVLFFALIISSSCSFSQKVTKSQAPESIKGEWMIDLRAEPNADPYFQTLLISQVEENTFKGMFYGSKIKDAQLNRNWDVTYFAFRSYDNSNDYYHTGYFKNGEIVGTTYCPQRAFIMPWKGSLITQD